MSATGTGSKRKRIKIAQITVDGVEVDAKECTKCGEVKVLTDYYPQVRGLGGRKAICIECERDYTKCYNEVNKVQKRTAASSWYFNNKERSLLKSSKWRVINRQKYNKRARMYKLRRKGKIKNLPVITISEHDYDLVCQMTMDDSDVHLDHFIALSTGHGGTYYANLYPLCKSLNTSKTDSHPFTWFETNRQRFKLDQSRFDSVVADLAEQNGLTPVEYRQYVDWCFANKRSLDDIKADNKRYGYVVTSVELWREAVGLQFPLRFDNREQAYVSEEVA